MAGLVCGEAYGYEEVVTVDSAGLGRHSFYVLGEILENEVHQI